MKKMDTSSWGEYSIDANIQGGLFTIESPETRSITTYSEGEVPYVSSGAYNNGVKAYLEPKKDEQLEKGNCITVSPLDGSSFFQESDFLGRGGAGSAISKLYNDKLTKYNALFICTVIKKTAQKFDYSDALTGNNLKSLKILLPKDEDGEPDWEYMDNYMKQKEENAQKKMEILLSLLNQSD